MARGKKHTAEQILNNFSTQAPCSTMSVSYLLTAVTEIVLRWMEPMPRATSCAADGGGA
jgi:hypothetical protein